MSQSRPVSRAPRAEPATTAWIALALAAVVVTAGCGGGRAASAQATPLQESSSYKIRMAVSLQKAGRIGEALETVAEAIRDEPDNAGLHHFYGEICLQGGRLGEAETAFRRALELDSYMTDSRIYLGAVYQDMNRPTEAEQEYLLALENPAYPNPEKAYLGLGILYLNQNRLREAEDNLRLAVGVNPKYYAAHYRLASLLEQTDKLDEAAREYEVAEPGFRNDGEYWYRRGLTYHRLGERQKALDSLYRVRSVSPGSTSAARADELIRMME